MNELANFLIFFVKSFCFVNMVVDDVGDFLRNAPEPIGDVVVIKGEGQVRIFAQLFKVEIVEGYEVVRVEVIFLHQSQ